MRYLTLTILLSGALAAQTPAWQQPNLKQYFKQFTFPEVAKPAVNGNVKKCAIPLINALKKDTTNDRMVFHVPPSSGPSIMVPPPAPSCDDVR